jgi:hypothetical protein
MKRSGMHTREPSTAKAIPRSAAQSHSSHSKTRCSNAHTTTKIRNRNTTAQHPSRCARNSAGNARPRRASYITRTMQPQFVTFSQAQRAPHAHADKRRAPRYHHTTNTCAQTHATRQAPSSTTSHQRHGACHPKTAHTYKPRTPHRTLSRSIQTHKPPHVPYSCDNCALRHHQCAHSFTHATHSTAHRSDHPTRRPQKITPSHTRPPHHTHNQACRLLSVDGMLPESWLVLKSSTLQRTHEQPSCHTLAPTPSPTQPLPAARNELRRIA